MSSIEMIENDEDILIERTEEEDADNEAKRIIAILASQSRRAECGSVVKIPVGELLEQKSVERMSEKICIRYRKQYRGNVRRDRIQGVPD